MTDWIKSKLPLLYVTKVCQFKSVITVLEGSENVSLEHID